MKNEAPSPSPFSVTVAVSTVLLAVVSVTIALKFRLIYSPLFPKVSVGVKLVKPSAVGSKVTSKSKVFVSPVPRAVSPVTTVAVRCCVPL